MNEHAVLDATSARCRTANEAAELPSGHRFACTGANRGMCGYRNRCRSWRAGWLRPGYRLRASPKGDWRTADAKNPRNRKLGVRVLAQTCDVRSPESIDYLFTLVRALRRPLDFLVNNAGIGHPNRAVADLPYPIWVDVIETNLTGMFLMTQASLAVMKREA